MKIQDIVFIIVSIVLLLYCWKRPNWFVGAGIVCLLLSMPLFALRIFFTAERLVYYGALLVFVEVIFKFIQFGIKPRK